MLRQNRIPKAVRLIGVLWAVVMIASLFTSAMAVTTPQDINCDWGQLYLPVIRHLLSQKARIPTASYQMTADPVPTLRRFMFTAKGLPDIIPTAPWAARGSVTRAAQPLCPTGSAETDIPRLR